MIHYWNDEDKSKNANKNDDEEKASYICPDPGQGECNGEQPNNAKSFSGKERCKKAFF